LSEVIVITGGSRGIGAACAELLADSGKTLVINYVSNAEAADAVVAKVKVLGGNAVAVQGDVASESDILNLFQEADKLGTLVGLVNNAGVVDHAQPVTEMSYQRLQRMMNINVVGAITCAREAAKRMSTKLGGKGGAIVNLSSAAARLGAPNNYVDYAASKGAIDVFTTGLSLELADAGVRVTAIRPGVIDTDIHASGGQPDRVAELRDSLPMKREGTAKEVAEAIVWLMSDKASYVTNTIIDVSGGR